MSKDNPKYLKRWKRSGWKKNTEKKKVKGVIPKFIANFIPVWVRNPKYKTPEPTLETIKVDDYLRGNVFPIADVDSKHRAAYRDTLARLALAAYRSGYGEGTGNGRLYVSSSYRTRAEQQRLYELYKMAMGALAAPVGTSMHEFGLAVDVPNARYMKGFMKECRKLGLVDDVPIEKWHLTNHQWKG